MTIALSAPVIGLIIASVIVIGSALFMYVGDVRRRKSIQASNRDQPVSPLLTTAVKPRPGPIYRVFEIRPGGEMKLQKYEYHNGCVVYAPKGNDEFSPIGLFDPEQNTVNCFGRECKLDKTGPFQSHGSCLCELWTFNRLLAERVLRNANSRAS